MKKSDNIFIAGHKGLVGSAVLNLLKNKGFKNLITIDRKKIDLKDFNKLDFFLKIKKLTIWLWLLQKLGV